jgi:hypothetical protein
MHKRQAAPKLSKRQRDDIAEYGVAESLRVVHVRDASWLGCVQSITRNLADVTTCFVLWDGDTDLDVQWTNKLRLVP